MTQARSEEARSSPSQRRRGEDSTSTGELQPMPTSPGADLQSPAAQDALFSSPPQMHSSGGFLKIQVILWLTVKMILKPVGFAGWIPLVDITSKHSLCSSC
jgi:hypothetical protein